MRTGIGTFPPLLPPRLPALPMPTDSLSRPDGIRALIERITAALGPDATPAQVETIARAVLASEHGDGSAASVAPPSSPTVGDGPISGRILVTSYGCDRPGILAALTTELFEAGVNVLDVSQKILQGYFTLILLADLSDSGLGPSDVQQRLAKHADRLGVRVLVQHEELFYAMHRP
jgi:ACT domain-containing protein